MANIARKQLEQKRVLYLKRLCGVPSTTSHAVILAELNMRSLKHFWWQQITVFWNALASAPAFCLHRLFSLIIYRMHLFMVFTIFLGQSLIAFTVLATIYLPKSKVVLS